MKPLILVLLAGCTLLVSCKKDQVAPVTPPEDLFYFPIDAIVDDQHPYQLDIDDDGKAEFSFFGMDRTIDGKNYNCLFIKSDLIAGSRMVVYDHDEPALYYAWTRPFIRNSTIGAVTDPGYAWNTTSRSLILCAKDNGAGNPKNFMGPWTSKKGEYIGIVLTRNDKNYYGWIQIYHSTGNNKIYIEDLALNLKAGEPIIAGHSR